MMWTADDREPPTTPSLRGSAVRERAVTVEFQEAAPKPPTSTSVPLIRVARWLQAVAKGDIIMGPGATSAHSALLAAVAQYQGQNAFSTAGQRTLAAFANTVERTARTALAELVTHGWLLREDNPNGEHGYETRYAVAATPGRPIPARPTLAKAAGTPRQPLPDASDAPAIGSGGSRHPLPEEGGIDCRNPPAAIADKKTIEETTEETTEKTIARTDARACTRETKGQGDLFGETPSSLPPSKPKRQPRKGARPRWRDYADAFVAGCADAGTTITPLAESEARTLGRVAAAHAKGSDGQSLAGPDVDAWIRKAAAVFTRAGGNLTAWNFKTYCDRTMGGGGARSPQPARAAPIRVQPGGIASGVDPAWDEED